MQCFSEYIVVKRIEGRELTLVRADLRAQYPEEHDLLAALEQVQQFELRVPLGESGAYSGGNRAFEEGIIDPNNQLDWIIRATLNVIQGKRDNRVMVYHDPSHVIWLGCINITETINSNGFSEYDVDQLKQVLIETRKMAQPGYSLVFNTRLTKRLSETAAGGMAHYETFFIHPTGDVFDIYHIDSRYEIGGGYFSPDELAGVLSKALTQSGYKVRSMKRKDARYNQNALSCGTSAVGELMDFLISPNDSVDRFLDKAEANKQHHQDVFLATGRQRRYDDLSPKFKDVNGQPLTREIFMRLVQYYFVAREWEYPDIQRLLTMSVFNCFLINPKEPDRLYPIPYRLLEEYAVAAYPLLTQTVDLNGPEPVVNFQPEEGALSGDNQPSLSSLILWDRFPFLLLNIMQHRYTRYGMLLVYLAAIVGCCVALSAFCANPVALGLVHSMAMSTVSLTVVSGVVAGVSGSLSIYGLLSRAKSPDVGTEVVAPSSVVVGV